MPTLWASCPTAMNINAPRPATPHHVDLGLPPLRTSPRPIAGCHPAKNPPRHTQSYNALHISPQPAARNGLLSQLESSLGPRTSITDACPANRILRPSGSETHADNRGSHHHAHDSTTLSAAHSCPLPHLETDAWTLASLVLRNGPSEHTPCPLSCSPRLACLTSPWPTLAPWPTPEASQSRQSTPNSPCGKDTTSHLRSPPSCEHPRLQALALR
jgi:hypothetical protein